MDPASHQGELTRSANYESSPGQILSSLQTVLSVSLLGSEAGSPPSVFCPHQPCGRHGSGGPRADRGRQPAVRAVAARYLFREAGAGAGTVHNAVCHRD